MYGARHRGGVHSGPSCGQVLAKLSVQMHKQKKTVMLWTADKVRLQEGLGQADDDVHVLVMHVCR